MLGIGHWIQTKAISTNSPGHHINDVSDCEPNDFITSVKE